MDNAELLARIAETLKATIAPAVTEEYARTQAYMAAVVLQKLGQAEARAEAHARAAAADLDTLRRELAALAAAAPLPAALASALAALSEVSTPAALCTFIDALYASRERLETARFEALLTPVRRCLRRDIDRRLEYAA